MFFLTVSTSLQQIFMRRYPLCAWEYWLASDSNNLVAPYLSNITQENLIRIQERDCVENTYLQYWVPSGNISRKISSQLWRIRSSYCVCVYITFIETFQINPASENYKIVHVETNQCFKRPMLQWKSRFIYNLKLFSWIQMWKIWWWWGNGIVQKCFLPRLQFFLPTSNH